MQEPYHERPQAPGPEFDNIAEGAAVARRAGLRGQRRALAINAVQTAREHADRGNEPFSQMEADVIMYITELLDKVAGGT